MWAGGAAGGGFALTPQVRGKDPSLDEVPAPDPRHQARGSMFGSPWGWLAAAKAVSQVWTVVLFITEPWGLQAPHHLAGEAQPPTTLLLALVGQGRRGGALPKKWLQILPAPGPGGIQGVPCAEHGSRSPYLTPGRGARYWRERVQTVPSQVSPGTPTLARWTPAGRPSHAPLASTGHGFGPAAPVPQRGIRGGRAPRAL